MHRVLWPGVGRRRGRDRMGLGRTVCTSCRVLRPVRSARCHPAARIGRSVVRPPGGSGRLGFCARCHSVRHLIGGCGSRPPATKSVPGSGEWSARSSRSRGRARSPVCHVPAFRLRHGDRFLFCRCRSRRAAETSWALAVVPVQSVMLRCPEWLSWSVWRPTRVLDRGSERAGFRAQTAARPRGRARPVVSASSTSPCPSRARRSLREQPVSA